jgi:hypothetical protein
MNNQTKKDRRVVFIDSFEAMRASIREFCTKYPNHEIKRADHELHYIGVLCYLPDESVLRYYKFRYLKSLLHKRSRPAFYDEFARFIRFFDEKRYEPGSE